MIDKKYLLILLIMLTLFTLSSVSASDLNLTDDDFAGETVNAIAIDDTIASGIDFEDKLSDAELVLYFDASASSNGDGSKSRPYKYVNQNTLNVNSGKNITAYFADGIYSLNTPFKITSNVVLIGESKENTIFNSALSNKYDFEVMDGAVLEFDDLTFWHANIINHGELATFDVNFNNSKAFSGNNAPSTYNPNFYDSSYGGVILCDPIEGTIPFLYMERTTFNNNNANCGGSIAMYYTRMIADNCNFYNSVGDRKGGVIYALGSAVTVRYSYSDNNRAEYGGFMYCEYTDVYFKNSTILGSEAKSFGGAVGSKYSSIDVEGCDFIYYYSYNDAGGAFYMFKGELYITDSYFRYGGATFGGAIANLQSNLTVTSTVFRENEGTEGGVIYNMYGNLRIMKNTFYRTRSQTDVISSDLPDSVLIVDNIFANNSANSVLGKMPSIYTQNQIEDLFNVFVVFTGYLNGQKITVQSNVLNYLITNTGRVEDDYEPVMQELAKHMNLNGDSSRYVSLKIYDSNRPDKIFLPGDCFRDYNITLKLNSNYDLKNCALHFYQYYNGIDIIGERYALLDEPYADMRYSYNYLSHFVVTTDMEGYDVGQGVISLINSTPSDLDYIPSRYDSRDYGYITSVKNQTEGGNCWAFSGIATLEACIKKITGIEYDFSEENVKNMMASFSTMGLDLQPNYGGYDSMVMGYLTSWFGPIFDSIDMYDPLSSLATVYEGEFHIQNIKFLPVQNTIYLDEYKQAIMDYGAVSVSFDWTGEKDNHAVSIVGWDDNYNGVDALGNHANGAWIFKNSWGPDWGDNGFGYLSYDVQFLDGGYTFIFKNDQGYGNVIHYDYSGVNDYICVEGPIYAAIGFGTSLNPELSVYQNGELSAFATYFKVPTVYSVSIMNLRTKEVSFIQYGYSDAGYYTIPFEEKVHVDPNDDFLLVVGYLNKGWNYLPVCQAERLTKPYFKELTSFIDDGDNFEDLYDLKGEYEFLYKPDKLSNTCQAACIHLFVDYHNPILTSFDINKIDSVSIGQEVTFNIAFTDKGSAHSLAMDTFKYIDDSLVTININGKDYYAMVHDAKASLKLRFDEAGVYHVKAYYKNNVYGSEVTEFDFTVKQIDTETSITSNKNSENSVTFTARVNSLDASGEIVFNVNGIEYYETVENGKATLKLSNLDAGSYVVKATYEGNENYAVSSSKSISFDVGDSDFTISAPDVTKFYGGSERFTVTLKDKAYGDGIANAKVTININGVDYERTTDSNGMASMALGLPSKVYEVTTTYEGYSSVSTVTIMDSVSADDFTKMYKNGTQYYGTFVDTNGNRLAQNTPIEININGVFYTRYTDNRGVARMNINLNPGTYVLTAKNPATGEMHTTTITVLGTIVENNDLTKYYKNDSQYSLRLLDDKGKPLGAGVSVRLNINGVFYTRTSNEFGYVKMNINLNPGEYIITAEYNGLMASNKIKVLPVIETKNLVMRYRDGSKFEAKILDGQGYPYAGQKVTFNINGVFYEKTTDSNGIARLTINLMAGEYIITSSYNGLNAANKVTIRS